MNKALATLVLVGYCTLSNAQSTDYSMMGNTVNSLFESLSSVGDSSRTKTLGNLLTPAAPINSVIHSSSGEANLLFGTVSNFLVKSADFYKRFEISYTETERESEYYVDMASVHSSVVQTAKDRTTGKVYEQKLWFQIDLVYASNRWYIDYLSWTNENMIESIMNAQLQDTLWHKAEQ